MFHPLKGRVATESPGFLLPRGFLPSLLFMYSIIYYINMDLWIPVLSFGL